MPSAFAADSYLEHSQILLVLLALVSLALDPLQLAHLPSLVLSWIVESVIVVPGKLRSVYISQTNHIHRPLL